MDKLEEAQRIKADKAALAAAQPDAMQAAEAALGSS
jgi:hypothetical protein